MARFTIPQKRRETEYYDTYKAMKNLGLTIKQAITETDQLFIENNKA